MSCCVVEQHGDIGRRRLTAQALERASEVYHGRRVIVFVHEHRPVGEFCRCRCGGRREEAVEQLYPSSMMRSCSRWQIPGIQCTALVWRSTMMNMASSGSGTWPSRLRGFAMTMVKEQPSAVIIKRVPRPRTTAGPAPSRTYRLFLRRFCFHCFPLPESS